MIVVTDREDVGAAVAVAVQSAFVLTEGGSGAGLLDGYKPLAGTYDELVDPEGRPRPWARAAASMLEGFSPDEFAHCQDLAELALAQQGVTFSVYSDRRGTEKVMPVC